MNNIATLQERILQAIADHKRQDRCKLQASVVIDRSWHECGYSTPSEVASEFTYCPFCGRLVVRI
jgi:hypothetical protein